VSELCDTQDKFISRDLIDIARTAIGRYMNFMLARLIICVDEDNARACTVRADFDKLMYLLGELLACHEDYSLNASFKRLAEEAEVTESFETTLKRNASARYCRSYIAEHVRYLYPKECRAILDWVCTPKDSRPETDLVSLCAELTDEFINTPLCEMNAPAALPLCEILDRAAEIIDGSLNTVLN
jgi:hypothetical protein